jgi:membrane fusion protein (multidrug efflux system)
VRYVIAIIGLLGLTAALGGLKYKQISSLIGMAKAMQASGPPPESVGTAKAVEQAWQGTLSAVGSVSAQKGVTVANEVPGVVTAIRFESGAVVKAGQVLVELDSSVERAQLASALAQRDLARTNAGRSRALVEKSALSRSQLDGDEAALKSSTAEVGALEAQIERKTVRAPFAGRLGIRAVNLGQYLNPGTAVTVLQSVDHGYVDFTLPQQRIADVAVGMPVKVGADGIAAAVDGTIAAIDPTVDATTRTIKLRATVKAPELRPGMFVNVTVVLPNAANRVIVPATALVHASYGDSVFVVEDGRTARQQFVRAGETRGDYVAILDGVKAGQEVVTAGAFKLRNGAPVAVHNEVQPAPKLDPRPENR